MADLTTDIVANATGLQSVTADGVTAVSQSVDELIKADQYVAGKAALRNRGRGLRFTKVILGGQVSGLPGPTGGYNGLV